MTDVQRMWLAVVDKQERARERNTEALQRTARKVFGKRRRM